MPAEAYTVVNAVNTVGYSGLTGTAKALRDAGMVYNCMDLTGAARTSCQAALAAAVPAQGPAAGRDDGRRRPPGADQRR